MTEIELRLHLLTNIPTTFKESRLSPLYKFQEKFYIYYVKAIKSLMVKFHKLHEDIQFDMKAEVVKLLDDAHTTEAAGVARELGLPKDI